MIIQLDKRTVQFEQRIQILMHTNAGLRSVFARISGQSLWPKIWCSSRKRKCSCKHIKKSISFLNYIQIQIDNFFLLIYYRMLKLFFYIS